MKICRLREPDAAKAAAAAAKSCQRQCGKITMSITRHIKRTPTQPPCDPQHPRPRSQWAWTWTWAWATVARGRTADQFWDMNMAFFESHMKRPTAADRRTGQIGCGIYHKNAQGTGYWILDGGFWMRGTGSSVQGFGFLLSGCASRGGDNNTCATTAVAAKITGQWS